MQVFFRFRSEKSFSRIETERSSMPLWELKAEIVSLRQLTLHDYHLVFYLDTSNQPITDNYTAIHSNTNIIIERVPNYMQVGYKEALEKTKPAAEAAKVPEEASSISVLNTLSSRTPPSTYICFRCGQKGHYIQMCPTNNIKQYDAMRVKKATGIPKTFLVPAEETSSSVLLNEEGKFVRAQPQTKEFSKHFGQQSVKSAIPSNFICPRCKEVLADAVRLECRHTVCECCAGGKCPVCGKRSHKTATDTKTRKKIEEFLENIKCG
ncbi:protein MPE1 [Nematocida displodere]|uniref:Protein MPE1 n=1 Tax=Nematocida displodere TaxID=1805483 RepID=A0A177EE08_9MICR|nr:protein MPE1 [Nematocida displodere]